MEERAGVLSTAVPIPQRKGDRTRAKLILATVRVLGRIGYAATSVAEITRAANVSNATFYLYFKNKEDVMDVAVFQAANAIMERVHQEERHIEDIVERCIFGVRRFISLVCKDPVWTRAMLATHAALPELRTTMNRYGSVNLRTGIEEGAFNVSGSAYQFEAINAVVMTAVRTYLEGTDTTEDCVDLVLRMLGTSPERLARRAAREGEADEIWRRPSPRPAGQ